MPRRCRAAAPAGLVLAVGCLASAGFAAAAASPSDATALLQHAVRSEHEGEALQPSPGEGNASGEELLENLTDEEPLRNLTNEELQEATSHLAGLSPDDMLRVAQQLLAMNCTSPTSGKDVCKEIKGKAGALSQQELADRSQSDFIASRLCVAHFGSGISLDEFRDNHLLDFVAQYMDYDIQEQRAIVRRKTVYDTIVNERRKTVQVVLHGTPSTRFKFIDDRYGCVVNTRKYRGLAKSLLPPRARATSTPDINRGAADSSSRQWAAVDGDAVGRGAGGNLAKAVDKLMDEAMNQETRSVLVLKGDRLWESYRDSSRETRLCINSVGKSVLGLLVSKLQEEQDFDMQQEAYIPLLDYFWAPDDRKGMNMVRAWGYTLYNLLNMLVYKAPEEGAFVAFMRDAGIESVPDFGAALPIRAESRLGHFYYATGNSHILSGQVRHLITSKKKPNKADQHRGELEYADYAWETLFRKIGATSFLCERDPTGNVLFGSSCWATGRDLVKLGLLMLHEGKGPTGEQVIPRKAVKRLFGEHGGHGNNRLYSNGWYRIDRLMNQHKCGAILAAVGVGGQLVLVVPKHDLVAVRQSYRVRGLDYGHFMAMNNRKNGYFWEFLDSIC